MESSKEAEKVRGLGFSRMQGVGWRVGYFRCVAGPIAAVVGVVGGAVVGCVAHEVS